MTAADQEQRGAAHRAAFAHWLERGLLATGLAATLVTMLLVARNQLTPVERPLTFGLVFWGWFLLLYMAIVLPGALAVGFLARFKGLAWIPRVTLALAVLVFLGFSLGANLSTLPLLLALEGPARFRWLTPAAGILCVLALLCLISCSWQRRTAHRLLATLGAAAGLGALLPARNSAAKLDPMPVASPHPSGERLLVIGLDGADWDYINPLIARGDLPNLAALRRRAAWGALETLKPTLSPPIWTSIVTGRTPEEHGVKQFSSLRVGGVDHPLPEIRPVSMVGYGLLYAGLLRSKQVDSVRTDSTERKVPAFWNIASAYGSPVNVVSWWATWPAEPVLGSMVSDSIHSWPPGREDIPPIERLTYPDELYGEIAHLIMHPSEMTYDQAQFFLDLTPGQYQATLAQEGTGIDRQLTNFFSYFETTRRIVLHLLNDGRARYGVAPDTLLLFRIVDKICHNSLIDSELVADRLRAPEDRVRRYGRAVSAAYRVVDRALGEIMTAFGEGSVIVVSDHGFSAYRNKGRLLAHHWLAPKGIFMAAGPPFRPGRVEGLSIYDILPLMLYVKGFPIAADFVEKLDKRVIANAFLERHPVLRLASYGKRAEPGSAPKRDPGKEAEAFEHLRALGYVQ